MKLKGVNLGGYLVLEKWITPDLFQEFNARDEYSLHLLNQGQLTKDLKSHYESFISEEELKFIKDQNVNAIRIPIGHYIYGDFPPYPKTIEYLENLFNLAYKVGLLIILDLHTSPGSQNGWDHSGKSGSITWHKSEANITVTLKIINRLSKQFGKHPNLYAIELLNEPHYEIPISILKSFYLEGYKAVKEYSNCNVIISDAFRPRSWSSFMTGRNYTDVILDMHLYQCFSQSDKEMSMPEHINFTKKVWGKLVRDVQKKRSAICGEWSLGIDPLSLKGLNTLEKDKYIKEYGLAQLEVFSDLLGHFFWTYKLTDRGGWNFKSLILDGVLPPL